MHHPTDRIAHTTAVVSPVVDELIQTHCKVVLVTFARTTCSKHTVPHLWFKMSWISQSGKTDLMTYYERTLYQWATRQSHSHQSVRSWCDGASDRSFMGWTHWAISRSSQCSTTGVTKVVVCAILSVGWCI